MELETLSALLLAGGGVVPRGEIHVKGLEPSSACRGAREVRATVHGSGFGQSSDRFSVHLGEDVRARVLEVRPDAVELALEVSPRATAGPREVVVSIRGRPPQRAALENGFTVRSGVDLALGAVEGRFEPRKLALAARVLNLGCEKSPPTALAASWRELEVEHTAEVPSLAPGEERTLAFAFPWDGPGAGTAASVTLAIDPEGRVAESDEENNGADWRTELTATPAVDPGGSARSRIWPWILGGVAVLGAGAATLHRQTKDRRRRRVETGIAWKIVETSAASSVSRPPKGRAFVLDLAVRETASGHALRRAIDR